MSGLTRERGDTVIGPRTSQSVLSSLLYRLCVSHSPQVSTRLALLPSLFAPSRLRANSIPVLWSLARSREVAKGEAWM